MWVEADKKAVRQVSKSVKQVHAYGGISSRGQIGLFLVTGTTQHSSSYQMTGMKTRGVCAGEYCNLLDRGIFPAVRAKYGSSGNWVLVQDNAPCHKAQSTTIFLNREGI